MRRAAAAPAAPAALAARALAPPLRPESDVLPTPRAEPDAPAPAAALAAAAVAPRTDAENAASETGRARGCAECPPLAERAGPPGACAACATAPGVAETVGLILASRMRERNVRFSSSRRSFSSSRWKSADGDAEALAVEAACVRARSPPLRSEPSRRCDTSE